MRGLLLLGVGLGAALLLAEPELMARPEQARVPVIDLRESLAGLNGPALGRGGLRGLVVPIPSGLLRAKQNANLAAAFAAFRSVLTLEPRLQSNACRAEAPAVGTWLSVESPDELAHEPSQVGLSVARGARVFALVTDRDSELATTSVSSPRPGAVGALTAAGRDVVDRIFNEGGLLDVSGLSEPSFDEALDLARAAKQAVIASHSNCRAITNQPQNLSDAQLRRVGESGGIVGISLERRLLVQGRRPELRDVVRHIRHALEVAGEDHVGLGTGLGGAGPYPRDLTSPADLPRLAAALEGAGLRPEQVAKVFSENARRVLCAPNGQSR